MRHFTCIFYQKYGLDMLYTRRLNDEKVALSQIVPSNRAWNCTSRNTRSVKV